MDVSERQFGECTSREANALIRRGTLLLKGIVEPEALEKIRKRTPTNPDILASKSDNIMKVFDVLANVVVKPIVHVKVLSIGGVRTMPASYGSHIDSDATIGLSALIPVHGPVGHFVARSHDNFILQRDQPLPEDCSEYEYGPGDILLVRQRIDAINDTPVSLPQVPHLGYGTDDRYTLAVDFIGTDLDLTQF